MEDEHYDSFSDDGFDDLPSGTLLQLEQAATQHWQTPNSPPPQPALNPFPARLHNPVLQDPSRLHRHPLSFGDNTLQDLDAGVLDDGGGPAPIEVEISRVDEHEGYNIQRSGENRAETGRFYNGSKGLAAARVGNGLAGARNNPITLEDADSTSEMLDAGVDELPHPQYNGAVAGFSRWGDIEEMREQVQNLAMERQRMVEELAAAKSMAELKAGEIAIIRANQAKMEKEHDRQLEALRTTISDQIKKHQAEIKAAAMDGKRLATENAFLMQDLKEEGYRIKEMQKAKARAEENQPPVTPKKNRALPLRDGFDDDEVMASPGRSGGRRSKRGTPSGSKRKRRATDGSPVPGIALQLSQTFDNNEDNNVSGMAKPMPVDNATSALPKREDRNTKFMRCILNHTTHPHKIRDLEVFTTLSFPSEPQRPFSSYVLDQTTKMSSENYAVEYAKVVISLWSRAMKEKFYKPVAMFMEIIKFILNLDTTSIAPVLIEDLLPVLLDSGYANGVPRFRNSPVSHLNLGQVKQTPKIELQPEVNSTEALQILYLVAGGCEHDIDAMRRFWRNMPYDFVLVMLHVYQPIGDIIILLNLLSYSILPETFGSILSNEAQQRTCENYIIDRVANLLNEQPCVDQGEKPYTPWQISTLRIEAMSFLTQIAFSSPGPGPNRACREIAMHPSALARVFRAMHDELDALYSNPPERDLHVLLVNKLTRLAYGVIQSFREEINLPAKLRNVPGATQKHLVVLTRLAFYEGGLLEEGIDDVTIEMAHEMLEDAVNPQEAEALLEAFRSRSDD